MFDIADPHYEEDLILLRRHRRLFEQPVFVASCIWQLFIRDLVDGVDEIARAISRPSSEGHEYQTRDFQKTFCRIGTELDELKRRIVELDQSLRRLNPDCSPDVHLHPMVMSIVVRNPSSVKALIAHMDIIDGVRNEILTELNALLSGCGQKMFKPIDLSSVVLRQHWITGADRIVSLLNADGESDGHGTGAKSGGA